MSGKRSTTNVQHSPVTAPVRSLFVTTLAWLAIVFGAYGVLGGILSAVVLSQPSVFAEFHATVTTELSSGLIATQLWHPYSWWILYFFTHLVIPILTLHAGIGLRARREQARRLFVGLLTIGIVWQLGSLLLLVVSMLGDGAPSATPQPLASMMQFVSFAIPLNITLLFGWIIWRMRTETVRSEFAFKQGSNG